MCAGRVDLGFVLRAFSNGMDGVFIGGCRLNECNYSTHGNYHALATVLLCRKIMEHVGLNPERLRIDFMSAGEGILFAQVMSEFGAKVKQLGPLGGSEGVDEQALELKLEAVTKLVPYIRLVERERLRMPVRSEEAYRTFFSSDEFNRLFNELIVDKLALFTQAGFGRARQDAEKDGIDSILDRHQGKPGALIQVLLEIQSLHHWLPRDVLHKISEKLGVPLTQVLQTATFYKTFRLTPPARHEIQVCTGSACHVRGSTNILDSLQRLTGIQPGETRVDSKFSLETSACLGCCNLGPEIIVDGEHHGKMTPAKAEGVLKKYE
jgi:F420-non-reducing hydrogenase iron-sulfur subunit